MNRRLVWRLVAFAGVVLLALAGTLSVGAASALADARPTIVSITLDAQNHAVVTWSKEPWQGSIDVKWSTGDGRVAAPYASWDGHYGLPLVDCETAPRPDPALDGGLGRGWDYGEHCKGQDVGDPVTTATTGVELLPGVYYYQVEVAGENQQSGRPCSSQAKGTPDECLSAHYSGVFKLTVLAEPSFSPPASPAPNGPLGASGQPDESGQPGPGSPQTLDGPGRFVLTGGQIDVGAGGQTIFNSPYNVDVRFGHMHLAENLVSFHCPPWSALFPPGTTLRGWIGVRCRTVTTPQAAALVQGTDFTVNVSGGATTFWVFAGQIEVST